MAPVILLFALLYLTSEAQSERTITFDDDLGEFIVNRGIWRWSDFDHMQYRVPGGHDGFAVYDLPGTGDELYSHFIPLDYGLTYEITFFFNARYEQSTSFQLHKLSYLGEYLETIADYTNLSSPINTQWFSVSGTVAPEPNALFSMFCQSEYNNTEVVNGWLWGCAIDSLTYSNGTGLVTTAAPATTAKPSLPQINFNFTTGTAGFVLSSSNGAAWERVRTSGEYGLDVIGSQVVSGVVLAVSPRLTVSAEGELEVSVTFSTTGSADYPAYFSVRRATSYTTFDTEPFLILDEFAATADASYVSLGAIVPNAVPGDEFFIVLEGSLGIDQTNTISVREVQVIGAVLAPVSEDEFFDFSGGLVGWTQGNIDGGRWQVVKYADLTEDIPAPSGDSILVVERFDIHSGVITIESPPLSTDAGATKTISVTVYVQGSATYPGSLRLRAKTLDGEYDPLPFLDLINFGTADHSSWQTVSATYKITRDYFQLVIEADLGIGSDNFVAIDKITIRST